MNWWQISLTVFSKYFFKFELSIPFHRPHSSLFILNVLKSILMLLKVVMNHENCVELHFNFQYLLLTWILIFQALLRGGCGSNTRRFKYFFRLKINLIWIFLSNYHLSSIMIYFRNFHSTNFSALIANSRELHPTGESRSNSLNGNGISNGNKLMTIIFFFC